MSCRKSSRLKKFVEVCTNDDLFDDNLKSSVFRTFLEVLSNVYNGKLKKCFSSVTRKKARKYKKSVRTLLNHRKSLSKRKKWFIKSTTPKFRKFVNHHLLCDFMKNCLDTQDD